MRKRKAIMALGISALMLIILISISVISKINTYKVPDGQTAYYIVYSNMLKKAGGIIGVDIEGRKTVDTKLRIQDVAESNFLGDVFIAGGSRANNNLIINQNGNYQEFFLLDDPNYSGVTAITMVEKQIVAIMNGNISDNTYKNLLVIQNDAGQVSTKKVIDIFAADILIDDNHAFITGGYLDVVKDQWSSKIIKYNLTNGEMTENRVSQNCEYQSVVCLDNKLYCVVANMNGSAHEIDVLNKDTLEIIETKSFNEEIGGVFNSGNSLFIVLDNTLCEQLMDGNISKLCELPEKTYVSGATVKSDHIYIFSRNIEKIKKKKVVELGYIIDYDIYAKVSQCTPLQISDKNNDSIVFFPAIK